MKKSVRTGLRGESKWVDDLNIQQVLPTQFVRSVGPFVFLDHISSWRHSYNLDERSAIGRCPVPRRGAITLTYIIKGQINHIDSKGNHTSLSSGCSQWLNAGFGIVSDQNINPEFSNKEMGISIIRAWINLPTMQKLQPPVVLSSCDTEIPKKTLGENAGWIKVLCGSYDKVQGSYPVYSKEFLYHIHIEPSQIFSILTQQGQEYAGLLLTNKAFINDLNCEAGEFVVFSSSGLTIEIRNDEALPADIILFGGEPLKESYVLEDAFVMNNSHEISQAYNDYYDGRYGQILPT